ncbi:hypothetical protein BS329_15290 [Amycolatopsis coloradensis]|uniref:Uncharacterized protein n=1 Tax=Amycolatopsis coloradensis TaxID=76021 RepID=A0A1R0KU22_9PSEU|nr:hypothetical protein [Amycolatopsis coloradensis]OLZ51629.1 hypothetical protein BS329_15290 [Amycolatopsis coloradensis]
MSEPKPIHEDIDLGRAWQVGRRIYVRCGYNSSLGEQLRQLGANWDRDEKRLWVGSGKKPRVIPLVQAADERVRQIEEIKQQGRWLTIPYEASDIRHRAKDEAVGGVYDGDRKQWAFPTDEGLAEIRELIAERRRREEAAAEEARLQRTEHQRSIRETEQAEAEQEKASRRERLITASGRTPTGDEAELRVISTRLMNKATAWTMAEPLGTLARLRDGRRGIVVDRKVWFTDEEMASSVCWHRETHDEAHWDILHTLAIVEPTAEEQAADDAERAAHADAVEIHQIIEAATRGGDITQGWNGIEDSQRVGVIRCWYGTGERNPGGTLIFTTDERVVLQHPGYYDDYLHTERVSTDPELVARVRAVLAKGSRQREHVDQLIYEYEVVSGDQP